MPKRGSSKSAGKRQESATFHWEIKGRFRKRVVLANVPSFRFSFRGNIRRNHPCVNKLKAHWEIKGRFRKRVVLANVPSFQFSFRGNIRQNHPFGNHPFANPRTFLQRSFVNVAVQLFVCPSAAFGANDVQIAEKRMLQCNFCSATFRKLNCSATSVFACGMLQGLGLPSTKGG